MKPIYLGLIFLTAPLTIQAQSIDSILTAIERNNIELKAMRSEITAVTHELKTENTLEAPSVEYSPFFRKGASGIASSELIVSQEFDFPTLYASRRKAGELQREVLDNGLITARRDILLNAKKKCLELIMLRRTGEILSQRATVADEMQRLFTTRFEQGDANILELNRVKMESMELAATIAENDAAIARARRELMAFNGNQEIDASALSYPDVPMALVGSNGDVSALADRDASLLTARASVASARQDVKVSRQGWLPKITLGYRRNTELDEATNGFLVGVAVPLYSTSNKVKAATARLTASQLYMDNARAQLENQISADLTELKDLHRIVGLYDLDLMKKTLSLMKKSVELGNMSIIDYYLEADKIYVKIQDFLSIENRYHLLAADLLKNDL